MATLQMKIVAFDESFGKLDIRVGRITEVELETRTHKPIYKMVKYSLVAIIPFKQKTLSLLISP